MTTTQTQITFDTDEILALTVDLAAANAYIVRLVGYEFTDNGEATPAVRLREIRERLLAVAGVVDEERGLNDEEFETKLFDDGVARGDEWFAADLDLILAGYGRRFAEVMRATSVLELDIDA